MDFKLIPLDELKYLREKYFAGIYLARELFIERKVAKANCYIIKDNNNELEYFIASNELVLLEFYLRYEVLTRKEEIFININSSCYL
jgi:hypothetical protein